MSKYFSQMVFGGVLPVKQMLVTELIQQRRLARVRAEDVDACLGLDSTCPSCQEIEDDPRKYTSNFHCSIADAHRTHWLRHSRPHILGQNPVRPGLRFQVTGDMVKSLVHTYLTHCSPEMVEKFASQFTVSPAHVHVWMLPSHLGSFLERVPKMRAGCEVCGERALMRSIHRAEIYFFFRIMEEIGDSCAPL